jgi:hypothetical protein
MHLWHLRSRDDWSERSGNQKKEKAERLPPGQIHGKSILTIKKFSVNLLPSRMRVARQEAKRFSRSHRSDLKKKSFVIFFFGRRLFLHFRSGLKKVFVRQKLCVSFANYA